MRCFWRIGLAIPVGLGLCASAAWANVFPSGLRPIAAGAGTCDTLKVEYVLNEDADGAPGMKGVKIEVVEIASGNAVRTIEIDRQKRGKWIFEWDGRDDNGNRVANGADAYRVRITAADFGHGAWAQISDDENQFMQIERPIGLAVNNIIDPVTRVASPYYGRIYVVNPRTNPTVSERPMGDGFYLLNADQSDALGLGDTASTGGLSWGGSATASPWKIRVGPDEHLYVSDWSDASGGIMRLDPDCVTGEVVLSTRGGTPGSLPVNHGSIVSAPVISGALATGDLKVYALDEDLSPFQALWLWDIGAGPLPSSVTNALLGAYAISSVPSVVADLDRGPDGKFYVQQYRSNGTDASSLIVVDETGTNGLWFSLAETRAFLNEPEAADLLRQTRSVAVSPDGARVALLHSNGNVLLLPLVNGIPDLSGLETVVAHNSSIFDHGQVCWDQAGNLYTSNPISERVKVHSPPTGPNSSTTASVPFSLQKTGSGGPTIQTPPASVSLCPNQGLDAEFSVVAANTTGTVHYFWKRDGQDVGSDSPTYTISDVTEADDGAVVYVVVCDDNGVAVSNPAVLNAGLTIAQDPASQALCAGGTAQFSVSVQGATGTVHYQWRKTLDGVTTPIGTDAPTLTLSPADAADNGAIIDVVVTDDCGTPKTSKGATLNVYTGPGLTGISGNKTQAAGTTFTYSITVVRAIGTVHYQWHKTRVGGTPEDVGSDSSFLAIVGENCDHNAQISVTVTDDCGPTTVNVGRIIITPEPVEICGNGEDDDCDGLTDCDDPECRPTCCNEPWADAEGNGEYGPGKGDGDVDQNDFGYFQLCFSGSNAPWNQSLDYCFCLDKGADNPGDGDIDLADLEAFLNCAAASGPAIPIADCP